MAQHITSNVIFQATHILNRAIKNHELADYILPIIFLKYVSDLRDEKAENNHFQWHSHKHCPLFATSTSLINFDEIYSCRYEADLGSCLNHAFQNLSTQDVRLNEVFRTSDYTNKRLGEKHYRNDLLRSLVEGLRHVTFRTEKESNSKDSSRTPLSDVLEALIDSKSTAIRTTPDSISDLVADLVQPTDGNTIYDPACGTGGMLLACSRFVEGKGKVDLYGAESHWSSWAAARMNFVLSCEDSNKIKLGMPITDPAFVDSSGEMKKFDIVISNFPWNSKDWQHLPALGAPQYSSSIAKSEQTRGDYSFILHMLSSTHQHTGKIVALVSNGALSRGGADGAIRRMLVEQNFVDAVIQLPERLLFETSTSSSILLLKPGRTERNVIFINVKDTSLKNGPRRSLDKLTTDQVVDIYRNRESVAEYSQVVSIEEISRNNYDLDVRRYIQNVPQKLELDLSGAKLRETEILNELESLEKEIDALLGKL